jgi:hypothetical protein
MSSAIKSSIGNAKGRGKLTSDNIPPPSPPASAYTQNQTLDSPSPSPAAHSSHPALRTPSDNPTDMRCPENRIPTHRMEAYECARPLRVASSRSHLDYRLGSGMFGPARRWNRLRMRARRIGSLLGRTRRLSGDRGGWGEVMLWSFSATNGFFDFFFVRASVHWSAMPRERHKVGKTQ